MQKNNHSPGLEQFWEQADVEGSGEHPLVRELEHRIDRLARYRELIAEAQAGGRDQAVEELVAQHESEARVVRRLREAVRRLRPG
jgi:hypothetical protein